MDRLKHKIKVSYPEKNDGKINEKIATLLGIKPQRDPKHPGSDLKKQKTQSKKILMVVAETNAQISKKASKQYLTLNNEKKMSKNKSMNFLFKTMPEKKQSLKPRKSGRKKSERSANLSIHSRELSKKNSSSQNLRAQPKKRSTRKKNEVKDMFELQLKKHLMQADQGEHSKSSYMDFNLERHEGDLAGERFSGEWLQGSSLVPELTTFKEIKFNIELEEKKMRKNIKRTIDKFIKKKNQMINSLQTAKPKVAKKKAAKPQEPRPDKGSRVDHSGYNSKKSSFSQKKMSQEGRNKMKKSKSKNKKKMRQILEKPKKVKKKKELNFYESEKKKRKTRHNNSTRIKTEEESGTLRNDESRQLEDIFAPLDIKRTYIDSGRNTGLLCKICLQTANRNTRERRGVHIPQCETAKCINNKEHSGRVPLVTEGIDERLDQALAESLLNMESEIIEKGFGNGFMESSQEPRKIFEFKESSIINEDIEQIGSEKRNQGGEESGTNGASMAGLLESTLKLNENESKLSEKMKRSGGGREAQMDLVSNSESGKGEFNRIDSDAFEKNKISIKEHSNFGILLSNDDLVEEESRKKAEGVGEAADARAGNEDKSFKNDTENQRKLKVELAPVNVTSNDPNLKMNVQIAKAKVAVPKRKKKIEK